MADTRIEELQADLHQDKEDKENYEKLVATMKKEVCEESKSLTG